MKKLYSILTLLIILGGAQACTTNENGQIVLTDEEKEEFQEAIDEAFCTGMLIGDCQRGIEEMPAENFPDDLSSLMGTWRDTSTTIDGESSYYLTSFDGESHYYYTQFTQDNEPRCHLIRGHYHINSQQELVVYLDEPEDFSSETQVGMASYEFYDDDTFVTLHPLNSGDRADSSYWRHDEQILSDELENIPTCEELNEEESQNQES